MLNLKIRRHQHRILTQCHKIIDFDTVGYIYYTLWYSKVSIVNLTTEKTLRGIINVSLIIKKNITDSIDSNKYN